MKGLICMLVALAMASAIFPAVAAGTPGNDLLVLAYHDVRDDVAPKGDPDAYATSTGNLAAQFDWLKGHGYAAVTVQQVLDARDGKAALPPRAVLLTFDDGLRSVYTRVFPLLRAYRYPAVVAPVTSWVDMPRGQTLPYGPPVEGHAGDRGHDNFVTWAELREMQGSGLVEIASHTDALHSGVTGDPQGSQLPAAVTHAYADGHYEGDRAYEARIRADLARSAAKIGDHLGRTPRVVVWPYGAHNERTDAIAASLGMRLSFDLKGREGGKDLAIKEGTDTPGSLGRLLMFDDPSVADLAEELRRDLRLDGMRTLQVDLDYVYDPDPYQMERNLDALVQRVHDIAPTAVFLQAFADPDGNGAADAVYFPNRHLPMRADLFNRAAWQLTTRAGVRVFAWLPVLGWQPPKGQLPVDAYIHGSDPHDVPRLDPRHPATVKLVEDMYADLARGSRFGGLLFHDDAYLRDDELAGSGDTAARTRLLIDFTRQLADVTRKWQPRLVTVRNLFARPVLEPSSEAWFAQRLDAFTRAYDYTALMAMPQMERAGDPKAWLRNLVETVKQTPGAMDRTLFELQSVDWRTGRPIPGETLEAEARELQAAGARHIGYYPDDFLRGQPPLRSARAVASGHDFPYLER